MLINPRKRRKKKTVVRRKRRHVARRRIKRNSPLAVLRNPRKRRGMRKRFSGATKGFKPMQFVQSTLMPSAIGAAGALGLDILLGFAPLPAALKTGPMRPVIRIVGAVGIGLLAGMVTNKRIGEQVGAGALTVVLYDTLKGFVQTNMPTLKLGEYDEEYPSLEYLTPGSVVSDSDSMGEYITPMDGIGETGEYIYNQ